MYGINPTTRQQQQQLQAYNYLGNLAYENTFQQQLRTLDPAAVAFYPEYNAILPQQQQAQPYVYTSYIGDLSPFQQPTYFSIQPQYKTTPTHSWPNCTFKVVLGPSNLKMS